jgi:hypothetical protein
METYCTVLAVLVEDNRLSHAIVHTSFIPDFNGRSYNRSITNSRTVELSTPSLFEGQLITG